jgi:predicted dehydrogenase
MRRRDFLASATASRAALGANERITIAQIGLGGRGHYELTLCREMPDVAIAAVCDPYRPLVDLEMKSLGPGVRGYEDFRRVLDRKDIDAVFVSTPDHWHAPIAVLACQAGKHVYCEKPLTLSIAEGRRMVEAARRYKRTVQTGSQQRSAPQYAKAAELIRAGHIGKVTRVECWNTFNYAPRGIGMPPDEPAPKGLNWDLYLGPAPKTPYNRNRFIWHYRWFWDYSGGMMTDWGAHHVDSTHHVMGVDAPLAVSATGGRVLPDNKQTPDYLMAVYEYPGFTFTYWHSDMNTMGPLGRRYGMIFYGTLGTLVLDRSSYEVVPQMLVRDAAPDDRIAEMLRAHAGIRETRKAAAVPACAPLKEEGIRTDPDYQIAHIRNWLDCIRSGRMPAADWEMGHRSATACHLGVISYRLGRKIRWDAGREQIIGDAEAQRMTEREYRAPFGLPAT